MEWSKEDENTILRMLGLRTPRKQIALHFGVFKSDIDKKIRSLLGLAWNGERKLEWREKSEKRILDFLSNGGAYVADDIKTGGKVWESLLEMEKFYIVCRASDYENPQTYNQWRITGCGRIMASLPGSYKDLRAKSE